jgi:CheY-specific phosphatase CheX
MHFISDFTQMAVREVYSTMLTLDVETLRVCGGADMPAGDLSGILGSVSFAGKINGTLHMHYSAPLARAVVGRMLGCPPLDLEAPEVSDVIGEITNMVSGTMKRHTSMRGYDGWLSPPVILRGDHIAVEGKGAPIAIFNLFRIPALNEELGVRVFVKLNG